MEVGNVNSKHFVLALKVEKWISCEYMEFRSVIHISKPSYFVPFLFKQVKSVLDPCEDENEGSQDDEVSLGAESLQRDGYSDSDSEVNV